MAPQTLEGVRQRITLRPQSHPSWEQRVYSRLPRISTLIARLGGRILWELFPPRSRLRRAALRRYARLAIEAANRQEFEAATALYHPRVELIVPPQLVELGFDSRVRGREERIRFQRRWLAEWGEFRFELEEVVDLGERLLMVGRVRGTGLSSGAAFDDEWADLFTVSGGAVIRERAFFDHGKALDAAGLRQGADGRLERGGS